jgi:ligand-binding sensor domain-containing protein
LARWDLDGCEGCYGPSIGPRRLAAWSRLFAAVVCCVLYSQPVFSKPVPIWAVFTQDNSELPSNNVRALALGADGSLWAGTESGLARLDKDGHWQTYSTANTQSGLQVDEVQALALGADRSLWVATFRHGLARLKDEHWQTYSTASTQGGLPSNYPMNFNAYIGIGGAHFVAGRYADTALWIEKGLIDRPSATWAYRELVAAMLCSGETRTRSGTGAAAQRVSRPDGVKNPLSTRLLAADA